MLSYLKYEVFNGKSIHVGLTGSISCYKTINILRKLLDINIEINLTMTTAAKQFLSPLLFKSIGINHVYADLFSINDDCYSHLEPSRFADCQLIAPATANFLAKMTHGIADDMLSSQVLAFPRHQIVAPAMNSEMWSAFPTQQNLKHLVSRGVEIIQPDKGLMACGDNGIGRLADEKYIYLSVLKSITKQDMANYKVLISLGPTHEYFDAARFWSNPSTGYMGVCLAISSWLRGADVTVVHGPISLWIPETIKTIPVTSASQMFTAITDIFQHFDISCMAAAVADFSPIPFTTDGNKYKKDHLTNSPPDIRFYANKDILAAIGAKKNKSQLVIGFCAETNNLKNHALDKLERKNCDLIVGNLINKVGSGFGTNTNEVSVLDKYGRYETWPQLPKTEVAWRIWDWVIQI
jgi:phosphopantothenoylcysteine decarboxylase/phosphopantothenate--cysteine ligase